MLGSPIFGNPYTGCEAVRGFLGGLNGCLARRTTHELSPMSPDAVGEHRGRNIATLVHMSGELQAGVRRETQV